MVTPSDNFLSWRKWISTTNEKMVFEYIEYTEEMMCQSDLKKYSYIWHQMKDCMNR